MRDGDSLGLTQTKQGTPIRVEPLVLEAANNRRPDFGQTDPLMASYSPQTKRTLVCELLTFCKLSTVLWLIVDTLVLSTHADYVAFCPAPRQKERRGTPPDGKSGGRSQSQLSRHRRNCVDVKVVATFRTRWT